MNRLPTDKRVQVIRSLLEGTSIRATARITGAAKNTVAKLLVDLGAACADYQDATLRELSCADVHCDEIWSLCYHKPKNIPPEHPRTVGEGDIWTWRAICADTKLVPSWLVGERTPDDAWALIQDLKDRLVNRVQLTVDGHRSYLKAVDLTFGADIDFAMLHEIYGTSDGHSQETRQHSPPVGPWTDVRITTGEPDPERISASYVQRQNLTKRMGMRRFIRLSDGFSMRVQNLAHAVSLHYMHYNFARVHQSLTVENEDGTRRKNTPAMAAGVADHVWTLSEIAALLDSNRPTTARHDGAALGRPPARPPTQLRIPPSD